MKNEEMALLFSEATPYIQKYHGKTMVIKYGGNAMINETLKNAVMNDLVTLTLLGVRVVLVHGGGPAINEMLKKVGVESHFNNGLRVTDDATMEIVQQVLAGKVNKDLVAKLRGRGVGLCGMDGQMLRCTELDPQLGHVGEIVHVDATLIGSLLASIVCGIIGTYIVTRRLVFISGGLTHASFGGIGMGLYMGISPILSAAVFSVLSAFGVEWLSRRKDMREDSAIAVFWTLGMALGIIFTFLSPGFAPDLSAYLFGNILTITLSDIALLGGLAILLILFFSLFLHPIIYVAFDREFARSQGIPTQAFEYILMMFIALTIVACLRMVGIVLVISLLTIPQMTANLFSHRFHRIIWLSIGIGYLSCLGGLLISYYLNVPSGAAIIFFSIIIYAICKGGKSVWLSLSVDK